MNRQPYKGFHGCDSSCGITAGRTTDGRIVVIATELPDNPGTSITNMAEHLATAICQNLGIDPHRLVWIEHYPARPGRDATWDLVTFKLQPEGFLRRWRLCRPQWRPMRDLDWLELGMNKPGDSGGAND